MATTIMAARYTRVLRRLRVGDDGCRYTYIILNKNHDHTGSSFKQVERWVILIGVYR